MGFKRRKLMGSVFIPPLPPPFPPQTPPQYPVSFPLPPLLSMFKFKKISAVAAEICCVESMTIF